MTRTSDLEPYPGNARRGDVDAIMRSLEVNGQFQPIIYQASTKYILVGNHTYRAAQKLRWTALHAAPVDVDDETAKRIVLAANRISDLATYDLDALATLLSSVDDLDGTGFGDADLAGLLDDDPGEEGPSRDKEKKVRWGCVIYSSNEDEQMTIMTDLIEQGYDVRAL